MRATRIPATTNPSNGIADRRPLTRRHHKAGRHRWPLVQVGAIDQRRIGRPGLNGRQRETHAAEGHKSGLNGHPEPLSLKELPCVHPGRNCRWVGNRKAPNLWAQEITRGCDPRAASSHGERQRITEQHAPAARDNLPCDDIHLRFVSGNKHVDWRTRKNLPGEGVRCARVEHDALTALLLEQRRDPSQYIGQTRRGRNQHVCRG